MQARLNYFNRSENWLTRMFTLEYSQWFDFLLPGLDWMKVPIPLGGTSNHFQAGGAARRSAPGIPTTSPRTPTSASAWRRRATPSASSTRRRIEEANGVLPSWIKQRSRWIKGYMQTWLVHMRHPIQLWRRSAGKGFFGFQFFIGAPPFTMLLNPILWVITALVWITHSHDFGWLFPEPIGTWRCSI